MNTTEIETVINNLAEIEKGMKKKEFDLFKAGYLAAMFQITNKPFYWLCSLRQYSVAEMREELKKIKIIRKEVKK